MFLCSRLVVWCLWSIQFKWDVLPTRPKLKSLQWNQMVLLERLGLLTEDHHDDDQTGGLLRLITVGRKILPLTLKPKRKDTQGIQSTSWCNFYKGTFCTCLCLMIRTKWVAMTKLWNIDCQSDNEKCVY